jgi:hypothetical protein
MAGIAGVDEKLLASQKYFCVMDIFILLFQKRLAREILLCQFCGLLCWMWLLCWEGNINTQLQKTCGYVMRVKLAQQMIQ